MSEPEFPGLSDEESGLVDRGEGILWNQVMFAARTLTPWFRSSGFPLVGDDGRLFEVPDEAAMRDMLEGMALHLLDEPDQQGLIVNNVLMTKQDWGTEGQRRVRIMLEIVN